MSLNGDGVVSDVDPDAAVFLVRQDRRALQSLAQNVPVRADAQPATASAGVRASASAQARRGPAARVPVGRPGLSRAPRFSCATDREDIGPRQAVGACWIR